MNLFHREVSQGCLPFPGDTLARVCDYWYAGRGARYDDGQRFEESDRLATLTVKLLHPLAKAPTVTHPGEDLGYDLYAVEDCTLLPGQVFRVSTGIAVSGEAQGVFSHGGVIDSSYRGEIVLLVSTVAERYEIHAGDKVAQLLPVPVFTGTVSVTEDLAAGARGIRGFGSSGR